VMVARSRPTGASGSRIDLHRRRYSRIPRRAARSRSRRREVPRAAAFHGSSSTARRASAIASSKRPFAPAGCSGCPGGRISGSRSNALHTSRPLVERPSFCRETPALYCASGNPDGGAAPRRTAERFLLRPCGSTPPQASSEHAEHLALGQRMEVRPGRGIRNSAGTVVRQRRPLANSTFTRRRSLRTGRTVARDVHPRNGTPSRSARRGRASTTRGSSLFPARTDSRR